MSAWNRSCSTPWCPVIAPPAQGPFTSAAVLSLYIDDETAKKITPKASEATTMRSRP